MKSIKSIDFKKIQQTIEDAAQLGTREITRGLSLAKENVQKFHLIQKRKELLADLGRTTFEAYRSGSSAFPLSTISLEALLQSDFQEIAREIEIVDVQLEAFRRPS